MSTSALPVTNLSVVKGGRASAAMSVEQQIVIAFQRARRDGDRDQVRFLRSSARALDPLLLAELDGFDYPAAA